MLWITYRPSAFVTETIRLKVDSVTRTYEAIIAELALAKERAKIQPIRLKQPMASIAAYDSATRHVSTRLNLDQLASIQFPLHESLRRLYDWCRDGRIVTLTGVLTGEAIIAGIDPQEQDLMFDRAPHVDISLSVAMLGPNGRSIKDDRTKLTVMTSRSAPYEVELPAESRTRNAKARLIEVPQLGLRPILRWLGSTAPTMSVAGVGHVDEITLLLMLGALDPIKVSDVPGDWIIQRLAFTEEEFLIDNQKAVPTMSRFEVQLRQ